MSALILEVPSVCSLPASSGPVGLPATLALLLGALAPWVLLISLQGVLPGIAAGCLAGPLPV